MSTSPQTDFIHLAITQEDRDNRAFILRNLVSNGWEVSKKGDTNLIAWRVEPDGSMFGKHHRLSLVFRDGRVLINKRTEVIFIGSDYDALLITEGQDHP